MSRPTRAGRLARVITPGALQSRAAQVQMSDAGHGFDRFGLHREWVSLALGITAPFYDHWFRVTSHDSHHIPAEGAAVLACNHSGTLPFDAMMVWADVVRQTDPPRVPRPIADYFVSLLPWVSVLYSRAGAIGGTRENFRAILDSGEMLLVFPEGSPGIGKPFKDRYKLTAWRAGHAELAIRHQVPVVPIAVVGAEEQMPQIGRIERIKLFGAPWLPITATPFPLPVHYHVWYGAPIALQEQFGPEQADHPGAVAEAARQVRIAVEGLIARGLEERQGVFR